MKEVTVVNIEDETKDNPNFRKILWTGENLQVSLMSLQPGEDIGLEVHPDHDQFFRVEKGSGQFVSGEAQDSLSHPVPIKSDWAVMVHKGTWHNIINTGEKPMKLYTIYGPTHHEPGTIHATKADDPHDDHEHH
ncbi:MAG: cupin domain-containing protein [Firmicutes bacterium]|nr:cupin domain-containing protein [Bacillota bacterium]